MGGRSLHTHTLPPHVSLSYPHETPTGSTCSPKTPLATGSCIHPHGSRPWCFWRTLSSLLLLCFRCFLPLSCFGCSCVFSNSQPKESGLCLPSMSQIKRLVLGIVVEQFNVLSDQSGASDSGTLPCPIPGGRGS